MRTIVFGILTLFAALGAPAQERRRVRIGGEDTAELTKDWPKVSGEGVDAVRAYLDAMVRRDLFSGTVLVARDGKPVFLQSYGLADRERRVANTDDTKYNLGSLNKLFTRVALLQLRAQGKIDFSKTLRTYLPDYPSKIADQVTIAQLIEHSAGMGQMFGPRFEAERDRLFTLSDYARLSYDEPLAFEPGTGRRYSNAGYIVLGLVVERTSGMTYYDYAREKIFEPAGMKSTDSYARDAAVPLRAIGYTGRETKTPNTGRLPARGSSAGGGYSTAGDLLRLTRALPGLLGRDAYRELVGGDAPGVGWGGGAEGINAALELEGPWAIIVLSNYDPPAAGEVARNTRRALGLGGDE